MDISDICLICEEFGEKDCIRCDLGNPCLNCDDYDLENDICLSNGGCMNLVEER